MGIKMICEVECDGCSKYLATEETALDTLDQLTDDGWVYRKSPTDNVLQLLCPECEEWPDTD